MATAFLAFLTSGCGAIRADRQVTRGAIEMTRQACGSCHVVPGIEEADGTVGPPLAHFAARQTIAGVLPNTPDNLVRYLQSPQAVVPGNAMPDQHLTRHQVRDIAAYLETLR